MNQFTPVASPRAAQCAIYVRVSTAGQEEDGSSLCTQEAACRAYAVEHGYAVAAVYREVHTGAELFERRELGALREAVRRREVGVVVAHALDRLTRNQAHLGVILSEAEYAGVTVELVTERLEDTPEGRLIQSVRGFVAEMERVKIAERTTRGRRARADAGKPIPGWKAPYGYRWADVDKSRLVECPEEAAVVRRLYREAEAGTAIRRIAHGLAADGIPSPMGRPYWPHSTIHDVLTLPTYVGAPRAFRTRVDKVRGGGMRYTARPESEQVALPVGVAPALVSPAMQEAVLARLARNKAEAPRRNSDPEATLLRSGFARCGYCDRFLRSGRLRQGWTYSCQGHDRGGDCPRFGINASILDHAAWERVEAVLTRPEIIAAEVERQRADNPAADNLAALDGRLVAIEGRRQRAARAVVALDDDEAAAPLLAELTSLAAQKRELENERATVSMLRDGWEADRTRLADLAAWCERVAGNLPHLTYGEKRDALTALGVQVRVWRMDHTPRWEVTMRIDDIVSASS